MNRVNYQRILDKILERMSGEREEKAAAEGAAGQPERRPARLLLHSCCAPCSSYVLEYLRAYFEITVLYYNPNITRVREYEKRVQEQERLIGLMNEEGENRARAAGQEPEELPAGQEQAGGQPAFPIHFLEGPYEPERFFEIARGLEQAPEGGERCFRCYELRLEETARLAARQGYDCFTTTLTISPLKDAQKLNEIGERLGKKYGVAFLPSDFKKKNGYRRSVELSEQYGLYRQNYCGCVFSERTGRADGCPDSCESIPPAAAEAAAQDAAWR